MKKLFVNLVRFLCFLFILKAITGCDTDNNNLVAIISEEEIIALVNNKKILLSDFQKRFQEFLSYYDNLLPSSAKKSVDLKKIVIQRMIEEELIGQEAARRGITVSDEELETTSVSILQPYAGARFERILKAKKLSETDWKERLKKFLLFRKLIQKEVTNKIPVTKLEMRTYYKNHRDKFVRNRENKVSHIVVSSPETAAVIRSQLKKGVSFTKLVREYSISLDKAVDGDMGYIARGMMPREIEEAIFQLRHRGAISQVVQSQHGYHIFRLVKFRKYKRRSYEESREQIKKILVDSKKDRAYRLWLEKLKKNASISIDENMLNKDEGF